MSETARCPTCRGTGRITVGSCAEIVDGRGCQNKMRPTSPAYLERYPERRGLEVYCGLHRNMRARFMKQVAELTRPA